MRILLTDGAERATLAAARSLRARGHAVHVAAGRRLSLAAVARGVHAELMHTDPFRAPAAFAGELAAICRDVRADVVLPVTDASVDAVLEHREAFPAGVTVPLPDLATYRAVSDKAALLDRAARAGFAVPETVVVSAPGDGALDAAAALLPGVLKPHRSVVVAADGRRTKLPVVFVADAAALTHHVRALPAEAFPVLVQRTVRGPGEGLFLLCWNGAVVAAFAHRRLREKPPAGGVSVYRESIPLPSDLFDAGARLLQSYGWNGVAMVECKRDAATHRPVIMEVNGRLWGSLQLAIDAGVDFPALLVDCALDGATGPPALAPQAYRAGVRSRWFWGDVDHVYLAWRHPRAAGRTRLGTLAAFLSATPRREREEVFRWNDPLPFAVETMQWLGLLR